MQYKFLKRTKAVGRRIIHTDRPRDKAQLRQGPDLLFELLACKRTVIVTVGNAGRVYTFLIVFEAAYVTNVWTFLRLELYEVTLN